MFACSRQERSPTDFAGENNLGLGEYFQERIERAEKDAASADADRATATKEKRDAEQNVLKTGVVGIAAGFAGAALVAIASAFGLYFGYKVAKCSATAEDAESEAKESRNEAEVLRDIRDRMEHAARNPKEGIERAKELDRMNDA